MLTDAHASVLLQITVYSVGEAANVFSSGTLVGSVLPFGILDLTVVGDFPSFSLQSTAPVVVGTTCGLLSPGPTDSTSTGIVYAPPPGQSGLLNINAGVGNAVDVVVWRYIHPVEQSGAGLVQPGHWVRSSVGEAATDPGVARFLRVRHLKLMPLLALLAETGARACTCLITSERTPS